MDGMLGKLTGAQIIALVAIVGTLLLFGSIILSAIIVPQWRRVRQLEAETKLKQELLASGMSSLEIVQIIEASAQPSAAQLARMRHLSSAAR
jgi:hypothetical protein